MARAVEAVVARGPSPDRAVAAGEAAVRLLGRHGAATELGYAHVTTALAALQLDDRQRAGRHLTLAHDLYHATADQRGLAWLDVIDGRLHRRPATSATRFHQRLGDQATGSMLTEVIITGRQGT